MRLRLVDRPTDLQPLEALFRACETADGHPPLGEHKYPDLVNGGGEASVGIIMEEDGALVGYLHLTRNAPAGVWGLEVAIHPDYRRTELVLPALRRALSEADRRAAGPVHFWTFQPWMAEAAGSIGFEEGRELLKMQPPLPHPQRPWFPPDTTVTAFRPGKDEQEWLEINNLAFAGHPENGSWDPATLQDRERRPWFDPEGFLIARRRARMIGFCWTKLHRGGIGEIYVVAVHPEARRRSLGRNLVLAGLDHLAGRHSAARAMLYVDASNRGAISMYEQLGFTLDHVDRCFVLKSR